MSFALKVLQDRARLFGELSRQFAVFNRIPVTGPFKHGKHLTTALGHVIDLTGMDSLALGSLPEIRGSIAEAALSLDVACPASTVVSLTNEVQEAEDTIARWQFPGADNPGAILSFVGFDSNEFLRALALGPFGGVLSLYQRETAQIVRKLGMPRSVKVIFFCQRHLHYSAQKSVEETLLRYPERCSCKMYKDATHLAALLEESRHQHGEEALRIIATDSLLSTTGTVFDMEPLLHLAEKHDCLLYPDEAHAGGILGPEGRGVTALAPSFEKLQERVFPMVTFMKGMCLVGSVVSFAVGSWKHGFEWECDHRVFSGTPSPFIARVLSERIRFIQGPLGEERRKILDVVVRYTRSLFAESKFEVLGTHHLCSISIRPQSALEVRQRLAVKGFLTSVFEPPAVPRGSALLRFGLRADLTSDEIDSFVQACRELRDDMPSAFAGGRVKS